VANLQWRQQVQQRALERRQILASEVAQDPTVLDGFPFPYVFVLGARGLHVGELFVAVEALETRGWTSVSWHLTAEVRGVIMRSRPPEPPGESPRPFPMLGSVPPAL
jgi:hypothetical protein